MVIASHIIWPTYGFWLPDEERGSWSTQVWAKHLRRFGPATKVNTRRSVAHRGYDQQRRREMQAVLNYPPVRLTGVQARAAARGFEKVIAQLGLRVHACAILPDHVHLVVARHDLTVEQIAQRLKSAATRRMTEEGVRPLADYRDRHGRTPTPWAEDGWFVYLETPGEVRGRIAYVDDNPKKHGLPAQRWPFVVAYDPAEAVRL